MSGRADPAQAFEALAAEHLDHVGSGRRWMFGRDCLTLDGHNVAFRDGERLAVKVPPEVAGDLVERHGAVVPRMGERLMRSWVSVELGGPTAWSELLDRARDHAAAGGPAADR